MSLHLTPSRRRLLVVAIVGLAIALALFLHSNSKKSVQTTSASPAQSAAAVPEHEQTAPGLPVHLKIPSINVDAAIESVGITSQGDMAVPKSPANAAWYNRGPHPGERGSSVIDGHFGYKDNIPAVFDNLSKLRSGDKIYVEDEKGATNTFVVSKSRSYDPSANDSDVFVSSDGKAHLNLITCEGAWNAALKSYSNRLVVFADKVLLN